MIVTLLEVAGSLPGNTGSKAKPWKYTYGIRTVSTYGTQPSTGSQGFIEWGPGARRSATSSCRGDGGARRGLQLDSLEQFLASRPETGAPQCFYPFEVRTQEETGSTRRLYNLANVLGVAQPAALQISVSEALWASAQEDATLLIEWALNLNGQGTPCAW